MLGQKGQDLMNAEGPRYRIDESVYFSTQKGARHAPVPPERFVVVQVMPRDRSGTFQYRLRPAGMGPLRMAAEGELRR
jgi:hypothetical protein